MGWWVDLDMKHKILFYIFVIVLFQCKTFPQEGYYISPGIQIGIDSDKNLFGSTQITLGFLVPESLNPMGLIHTTGLTIGYKKIRKLNELENYEWIGGGYCDIQFHNMESILQPGFGFGFIKGDNIPLTPRFKIWGGWFFLPSYEFINFKNYNSKHYFGLFGVLPLPIGVSGV